MDICLQVEIADCMQTLFRGNSLASKIMAYCFKIYGHGYLRELLNGLVSDMFIAAEKLGLSYEVDPARYVLSQSVNYNFLLSLLHVFMGITHESFSQKARNVL